MFIFYIHFPDVYSLNLSIFVTSNTVSLVSVVIPVTHGLINKEIDWQNNLT